MKTKDKIIPKLRFPEFKTVWEIKRIFDITKRISLPVKVEEKSFYQQIGIRSHGKGLFYKELVSGKDLGNKRVFWVDSDVFIVNIVFAWEQAIAKTTEAEIGMIASHRFPMYKPLDDVLNLEFFLYYFLRRKGGYLLGLASPGGAGRNKTLGQKEFEKLKIYLPNYSEQQKIFDFISAVDTKIRYLTKKKLLLEQYKKIVMQRIFSQQIRFKPSRSDVCLNKKSENYRDWEEKKLSDVATYRRGSFPQPYGLAKWYDSENGAPFVQVYDVDENMKLKSLTKKKISVDAQKQSVFVEKDNIVLTIQGSIGRIALTQYDAYVDRTLLIFTSYLLDIEKEFFIYLLFLLFEKKKKKAPGGTIKTITKEELSNFKIYLPEIKEQQRIADFLSGIDKKIMIVNTQIAQTQSFKENLLQQMFI